MEDQIAILGILCSISFMVAFGFLWGWENFILKAIGIVLWANLTLLWWLYPLVDKYFTMK